MGVTALMAQSQQKTSKINGNCGSATFLFMPETGFSAEVESLEVRLLVEGVEDATIAG